MEDDGRIQSLEQLVEELRTGYNELLEQTEKTVDRFENENAELKSEIASLKEQLANKDSEENEGGGGDPEPDIEPEAVDTEDPKNLDPDAYVTTASGTAVSPARKSIEYCPDIHATIQLHEFDDAPSVGSLTIRRKGAKLVLADPDGTTGNRKWMVPLRRDAGDKELKWALLGDNSDSDSSDSDSDSYGTDPCVPNIEIDEVGPQTGHPNGGYKITITKADCSEEVKYIWNGKDGEGGGGSPGDIDCCDVLGCLAGVPAPLGITDGRDANGEGTVVFKKRKFVAGTGEDCYGIDDDTNPNILTLSVSRETVLTGASIQNNAIIFTTKEVLVLGSSTGQPILINGSTCGGGA